MPVYVRALKPLEGSNVDCTRTSFVRELPTWFAPSVTIVPTERPPAEWFDKPLPRHPPSRARRFDLSLLFVTSLYRESCTISWVRAQLRLNHL
jgi:hypothetical protein